MKLKYLGTAYHYKPEYDIQDFARVNCMDEYDPRTVLKLMSRLYKVRLNENRPDLCEGLFNTNQYENANNENYQW